MRAGWFILILVALLAPSPWAGAQSGAMLEAAVDTDRAKRLAERFAGGVADTADATLPAVAVPPIEQTPLGQGSGAERSTRSVIPSQDSDAPAYSGGWILSTLTALGVVIGLIFLLRLAYSKISGTPVVTTTSAVEVLSRTSVAPKSHVLLLRVGGRVLIVGESSGGLRTLSELSEEGDVAQLLQAVETSRPQSIAGGFQHMLGKLNRDFDDPSQALTAEEQGLDNSEHQVDRARDSVASLAARLRLRSRKEATV